MFKKTGKYRDQKCIQNFDVEIRRQENLPETYMYISLLFIYFTYLLTLFKDAVSVPILNFSIGLEGMLVQAAVL
jgi:hypothetical protein